MPMVWSSECFPQRIPHSSYALGVIPASVIQPRPHRQSLYSGGLGGEMGNLSYFFTVNSNHVNLTIRGFYRFLIYFNILWGQSITFSFSIRGLLKGGYHPPLFSSVAGGVLGEPQRTIPMVDHQVCHHSDHEYLRVNLFYDLKSWYSLSFLNPLGREITSVRLTRTT